MSPSLAQAVALQRSEELVASAFAQRPQGMRRLCVGLIRQGRYSVPCPREVKHALTRCMECRRARP